jgi:hypothetical protein
MMKVNLARNQCHKELTTPIKETKTTKNKTSQKNAEKQIQTKYGKINEKIGEF